MFYIESLRVDSHKINPEGCVGIKWKGRTIATFFLFFRVSPKVKSVAQVLSLKENRPNGT